MAETQLSLATRLTQSKSPYSADDKDWVLFVKDYRQHILKKADSIIINHNDRERYRYRLFSYLTDIGRGPDLMWITLWLNQLDTELDFDNIKELYLPNKKHIEQLYQMYRSCRAKFKKESS